MLTKLVLIATISSVLPMAAQATWTAEYEFAGGARVIRTPQAIQLRDKGINITVGETFQFSRGSFLNGAVATDDGCLSTALTPRSFGNEVQKLGYGAPTLITQR